MDCRNRVGCARGSAFLQEVFDALQEFIELIVMYPVAGIVDALNGRVGKVT